MHGLVNVIDTLNRVIGRGVSYCVLAMAVITFVVVVLRYGFDTGWVALQESIMYLHGLVFMLGAAYTLREDGHVRVDVFYRKWQPKTQAFVNLLGTLLLLFPVCIFIFVMSFDYVAVSWRLLESSQEAGGLPLVFILKSLIPAFCIMLILQGFADVLRYLSIVISSNKETK